MSAELDYNAEVGAFKSWLASLHGGVEPQLIDCWLAARRATAGDAVDAARYRYIRDTINNGYSLGGLAGIGKWHVTRKMREGEGGFFFGPRLDVMIDRDRLARTVAPAGAAKGGITRPEGCIKCPRDPSKRCDYCGYFAATTPTTEESCSIK